MSVVQKDYFTSREAAGLLGVAVSTVQLWTNNGLLRAWTTAGGHRRIARNSVKEILADRRKATNAHNRDQQLSVVIVQDNAQQLRLHKKQFETLDLNAQVVAVKDGYEGLIKIGRILPDVIITDLMVPNINGFEMVRTLAEHSELEQTLIIVVCALTKDEIAQNGGLPEGVSLFTKPFPAKDVENLIRQKVQEKVA